MSHFSVLVVGGNPEAQLQPYHEYETTGIDDEYVVDVDVTEYVEEELNNGIFIGIDKKSQRLDYHYSEKLAEKSFESFEEVSQRKYLVKEGKSIDQWVKDEYGYYRKKNGKWFQYTNPNSKWDWYELGGRWTGFFKIKEGRVSITGNRGLLTPPAKSGYADQALKRNIDFAGQRSINPYAFVKNSKWVEKGKIDQSEWNQAVSEMIEQLPDNTMLSIFDCHI